MSRIVLSNDREWNDKVISSNERTGLRTLLSLSINGHNIRTYKKIKIDNCNSYEDSNDFVAAAGTFYYKSLTGLEALKEILADSKTYGVDELRASMYGTYAFAIKNNNKIIVFVDETDTFKLYYHVKNNRYIITNSYFQIGECIDPNMDQFVFVENFTRGLLGHKSLISEVRCLGAKEVIEIDTSNNTFEIKECSLNQYKKKYGSKEEFIQDLLDEISTISSIKAKYIRHSVLFLTGGVDSRLQLASDLQSGCKPDICYWSGQDIITNGTKRDAEIAEEIAHKNNLSYRLYDVSESFEDALRSIVKRNNIYGEYSSIYAGNSKWYKIFEELNGVDNIEFGYSGELLRDVAAIDTSYKKPYSIGDFIDGVIDRGGIGKTLFSLDGSKEYIISDISKYSDSIRYENLSKDEAFFLFSCTRFAADIINTNFANIFTYSFQLFFQKKIVDMIFSVPYEWLYDSNIPIRLIERIHPSLLETNFYSHHRDHEYDKNSHRLKESFYFRTIDYLKPKLVNTKLYSLLYLKYAHKYIRPQSIDNDSILNQCIEIIRNSKSFNNSSIKLLEPENWKSLDVAGMAVKVAALYSFDLLLES